MTTPTGLERRRRRRAVARAHHPDLGGDTAAFILAWQHLDDAVPPQGGDHRAAPARAGAATAGPEVTFVRRPTGLARWFAWLPPRRHRRLPTRRPR